jgi:SPP1 family predicted phage head-tail adaptor
LANEAAEVVPLSGREFIAADAKRGQMVARCTVRYRDGYEPSMRLRHKGAFYNIEAVLPDPKFARHLTLMLSTGVSDGR